MFRSYIRYPTLISSLRNPEGKVRKPRGMHILLRILEACHPGGEHRHLSGCSLGGVIRCHIYMCVQVGIQDPGLLDLIFGSREEKSRQPKLSTCSAQSIRARALSRPTCLKAHHGSVSSLGLHHQRYSRGNRRRLRIPQGDSEHLSTRRSSKEDIVQHQLFRLVKRCQPNNSNRCRHNFKS